jgi:hypothetical protein
MGWGFASCTATIKQRVLTENNINAIRKGIMSKNHFDEVVIMNLIPITEKSSTKEADEK